MDTVKDLFLLLTLIFQQGAIESFSILALIHEGGVFAHAVSNPLAPPEVNICSEYQKPRSMYKCKQQDPLQECLTWWDPEKKRQMIFSTGQINVFLYQPFLWQEKSTGFGVKPEIRSCLCHTSYVTTRDIHSSVHQTTCTGNIYNYESEPRGNSAPARTSWLLIIGPIGFSSLGICTER